MPWTDEEKLDGLVRLPWTVTSDKADDLGEFVVRVAELPGMIVVGTAAEIDQEFWPALRATLAARLEFGDPIPLPPRAKGLPWELLKNPSPHAAIVRQIVNGEEPAAETASSVEPAAEVSIAA